MLDKICPVDTVLDDFLGSELIVHLDEGTELLSVEHDAFFLGEECKLLDGCGVEEAAPHCRHGS